MHCQHIGLRLHGSETCLEPHHILRPVYRDSMSDVEGIDALDFAEWVGGVDAPLIRGVAGLRVIGDGLRRRGGVVAENTSPLLDGFVEVRRVQYLRPKRVSWVCFERSP